jgi:hypothetical protein
MRQIPRARLWRVVRALRMSIGDGSRRAIDSEPTAGLSFRASPRGRRAHCRHLEEEDVSEQGDQRQERDQEQQPSEEDRKAGTQQGNRESGTEDSGSQQGDVAHEGDLPTQGVPEAD